MDALCSRSTILFTADALSEDRPKSSILASLKLCSLLTLITFVLAALRVAKLFAEVVFAGAIGADQKSGEIATL